MRTKVSVVSDELLKRVDQEATCLVFDMSVGTKYKCRKYKQNHGPNLYCGFTRDPIAAPGDGRHFGAAILKNAKVRGRKHRVPVKLELFGKQREAREAALVYFCKLRGLSVDHLTPGQISYQERRCLLARLDGTQQLITLVGPALHIPRDEHETEQEQESTETEAAVSEPEALGKNADYADGEAAQTPQLTTEAHEQETGETPIPSRPLSFARLIAATTKAGNGVLALLKGHGPARGSRQ